MSHDLICPISQEPMCNPVMLIESGNVYDLRSILKWIENEGGEGCDPVSLRSYPEIHLHHELYLKKRIKAHFKSIDDKTKDWNDEKWKNKISERKKDFEQKNVEECKSDDKANHSEIFENDRRVSQIVRINDGGKLVPENILASIVEDNIPIIAFTGPARQGKSTLLDDLLFSFQEENTPYEEGKFFKISHKISSPCTQGIWKGYFSNTNTRFYVLDIEGLSHGFETLTEKKKLFFLIYSISNLIIWNDKEVLGNTFVAFMKFLEQTSTDLNMNSNKPAFLYLYRDPNDDYVDKNDRDFEKEIFNEDNFKEFMDQKLFLKYGCYILKKRENKQPFKKEILKKLVTKIEDVAANTKRIITDRINLDHLIYTINNSNTLSKHKNIPLLVNLLKLNFEDRAQVLRFIASKEYSFDEEKLKKNYEEERKSLPDDNIFENHAGELKLIQENYEKLYEKMKKKKNLDNFFAMCSAGSIFGGVASVVGVCGAATSTTTALEIGSVIVATSTPVGWIITAGVGGGIAVVSGVACLYNRLKKKPITNNRIIILKYYIE